MAIDLFLKVPGIPGDSTSRFHPDEIVLRSFSWGVAAPTVGPRPAFGPLIVTKRLDIASPSLEQAVVRRQAFPTITLTVVRPGEEPFDVAIYRFLNASIINFTDSAPSDEDFVDEKLSIQYSDVLFTFRVQPPTGLTASAHGTRKVWG